MKVHIVEKIFFVVLSVLLIGAIVFVLAEYPVIKKESNQQGAVTASVTPSPKLVVLKNNDDTLEVYGLSQDQAITSPLTLSGRAKGWYFEASFPVSLYDFDGTLLGEAPAQAQSDWMASDFVDFKVIINFSIPKGSTGILKFSKDNPSGLPQNGKDFTVPVNFTQTTSQQPKGTCKPDLASCQGDAELCMKENLNQVCS